MSDTPITDEFLLRWPAPIELADLCRKYEARIAELERELHALRLVAGRQREADAKFCYQEADKHTEYDKSTCAAFQFIGDLVSKNTLVTDQSKPQEGGS